MDKRYQVFVSSTYEDLIEERQEVMHSLLAMNCIPSGMELFPAADEDQWTLIKSVIEDCDYYLVIIAGRYGSVGSDGIGYTEKEYLYALEKRKPVIAFLYKDPGELPAKKTESKNRTKLNKFRKLAQAKVCKYWENSSELGAMVSRSLHLLIKNHPGIGWVRADELPDRDAMSEMMRLRRRIEELEGFLEQSRTVPPPGTEDLSQGSDEVVLAYDFVANREFVYSKKHTSSFVTTWNEIFSLLAPYMIDEASDNKIKRALDEFLEDKEIKDIQSELDEYHSFSLFEVKREDFQKIKVQLRALGLICKSERSRSVKDKNTYWRLTPYGDSVMTQLLAVHGRREEPAKRTMKKKRRKKES